MRRMTTVRPLFAQRAAARSCVGGLLSTVVVTAQAVACKMRC